MNKAELAVFCAIKWMMGQKGYGRNKVREILNQVDDIECFSFGSHQDLISKFGFLNLPFREWIQRRNLDELKSCYEEQNRFSDGFVHYWSEDYPLLLREVNDPPLLLYYRGDRSLLSEQNTKVAIVGTRCPTDYGRKFGAEIAKIAAENSMNIVSGMAMGIDAVAHINALEVNGRTVGVLGCGIDQCYPKQNRTLYGEMCKKGLLISEYDAKVQPHPIHFPERNRIIAGMSSSCVVIEAAKKSGSLITAEMVMDLGREVMALPGPIYSEKSAGCHVLIRSGAEPIIDLSDLKSQWRIHRRGRDALELANHIIRNKNENNNFATTVLLNAESKLIIESLRKSGQASIEELMTQTGLSFSVLSENMFNLENDKIVKSFGFLYHL